MAPKDAADGQHPECFKRGHDSTTCTTVRRKDAADGQHAEHGKDAADGQHAEHGKPGKVCVEPFRAMCAACWRESVLFIGTPSVTLALSA